MKSETVYNVTDTAQLIIAILMLNSITCIKCSWN